MRLSGFVSQQSPEICVTEFAGSGFDAQVLLFGIGGDVAAFAVRFQLRCRARSATNCASASEAAARSW